VFDKNFLFDGKSIKQEKKQDKEKNRGKGQGTVGASEEKWILPVGIFKLEGDKGKREGRRPRFGRTTPSAS